MATAAVALPRTRRRPQRPAQRAGGRASFTDIQYLKRIDNSHLRREVDQEKRRECYCLLGLGILVFLFTFLFAWQSFQFVRDGYQVEEIKSQRDALEEWNRQLRVEQASLADPQRIDKLARRELGLAPPQPQQVIRVGGATSAPGETGSPEFARNLSAAGELPREP